MAFPSLDALTATKLWAMNNSSKPNQKPSDMSIILRYDGGKLLVSLKSHACAKERALNDLLSARIF